MRWAHPSPPSFQIECADLIHFTSQFKSCSSFAPVLTGQKVFRPQLFQNCGGPISEEQTDSANGSTSHAAHPSPNDAVRRTKLSILLAPLNETD